MKIYVSVKPGALRDDIKKISGDEYIIHTTGRAESGKANLAVIKMIAKEFDVSFRKVSIKNSKGRKKIIEVNV